MRNKLTIVLVVLLPLTAFSQSKKKIHASLVAECAQLQESNDSLRKVCLETGKGFRQQRDNYNRQYSQLAKMAELAESAQKRFEQKVEDHNLMIEHFKLSNYQPILLVQPEAIPVMPERYRSPYSFVELAPEPTKKTVNEKENYAVKNLVLSHFRDSLLKWKLVATDYNASLLAESKLLQSKTTDLSNSDRRYTAIIQENKSARDEVTDEIFKMVAEVKKSVKKPDVLPQLEEYFYDYDKIEDYGAMNHTFDTNASGDDMIGPPPADIRIVEPPKQEDNVIYEVVEEEAEFPGGFTALKTYLETNLKYPQTAREMHIEGKVYLKFVVSKSGNISNASVLKGIPDCPECDKEAVRVVKSMPQWKPGKINGVAVHSWFNLPVSFKLP